MDKITNTTSRTVYYISFGVLLILLVAAGLLYKERMFFVDPCFMAFEILNRKSLVIAQHRYGAFITQIYPLIGGLLHLPLKAILILYSLSFYIFYTAVAYIVGFKWKQYGLGILLTFYFTLMVSDVYFWPNNEVHQGIGWMTLFLGFYFYRQLSTARPNGWHHFLLILLAAIAISSHLLVALPFGFLWLFLHLKYDSWTVSAHRKQFLWYSAILLGLMIIKFLLSMGGWYDGQKLTGVRSLSIATFFQAYTSGHSKSILNLMLQNYWLLFPVFLLGQWALLREKRYLQSALVISWALIYYALVCITFPREFGRELRFYMESEWMAFSLIIATPFVYYFLAAAKKAKLIIGFVAFIFLVRLVYIHDAYLFFHERYQQLEKLTLDLSSKGQDKVLIQRNKELEQTFIMDWGLPVESLMLSKMKGIKQPVSFKLVDENFIPSTAVDSFYAPFKLIPVSDLNSNYFQPNKTGNYILLKK